MLPTLLAAALVASAPVPKPVNADLKWRFAKGDTCYVKTEMENVATLNAGGGGGAAQGMANGVEYVYKLTVNSTDEKETTLELEFLSCKAGMVAGGAGVGGVKLTDEEGVVGKTVTVTLDKANKVTKLAGAANLVGPGAVSGLLSEEYLRYNLDDLIRAVPGKTLHKGDTWKGEEEFTLAEGTGMKRTDRGTVTGTEDGCTKLEVESDHAMTGGKGMTMDLKGEKGKRTVLFDPKAGRVRRVTEEFTLAGAVGIGGGGQNIQMSMTLKATVTVTDEKPKGEK